MGNSNTKNSTRKSDTSSLSLAATSKHLRGTRSTCTSTCSQSQFSMDEPPYQVIQPDTESLANSDNNNHAANTNANATLRAQQEHLLFLYHTHNRKSPHHVSSLLTHMDTCGEGYACKVDGCASSRAILDHFNVCRDKQCPVCAPILNSIMSDRRRRRKRNGGRVISNITTVGRNNILNSRRY